MDRKGIIAVTARHSRAGHLADRVCAEVRAAHPAPGPAPAAGSATPAPRLAAAPVASASTPRRHAADATGGRRCRRQARRAEGRRSRSPTPPACGAYHFTNLGGGISQAELTGYPAESGSNVDLNQFGTLPIGAISDQPGEGADLPYTVTAQGNTVLCVRDQPGGLSISKKFTLPASQGRPGYQVTLDVSFTNHGAQPVQSGGLLPLRRLRRADPPARSAALHRVRLVCRRGQSPRTSTSIGSARARFPLIGIETHPERPVYTDGRG